MNIFVVAFFYAQRMLRGQITTRSYMQLSVFFSSRQDFTQIVFNHFQSCQFSGWRGELLYFNGTVTKKYGSFRIYHSTSVIMNIWNIANVLYVGDCCPAYYRLPTQLIPVLCALWCFSFTINISNCIYCLFLLLLTRSIALQLTKSVCIV